MSARFKSACVTGGAGFIGSHLTRLLLDAGLKVTVIDDLSVGKRSNLPTAAELIVGDICDPEVAAEIRNSEVVFHLAARVAIRSSFEFVTEDIRANVLGTAELLKAMKGSKVKRFITTSSMAVYADSETPQPITEAHPKLPASPYGISKLAAEQLTLSMCNSANVESAVLRLFNTYGNGQALSPYVGVVTIFTNQILAGRIPTVFGDGEQRRDFVNVNDVAQAFFKAMQASNSAGVYNIGSGEGISVNQVYREIARVLKTDAQPNYTDRVEGELRYSVADIAKAKSELGYNPQVRFFESIEAIINNIKAENT